MKRIFSIFLVSLTIFSSSYLLAQSKTMPIIGVSSTAESSMSAAPLTYINSIKIAGGVPLVIPITDDKQQIEAVLNVIDALVMTGGEDVDPLFYGEQPNKNLGEVVPDRDNFDILLIKMAVEKGIPVLGICRGEQAMNIAFGGSLYQDIPSQVKGNFVKHSQKAPRNHGTHTIDITKGSLLYNQLGVESVNVNSYHHQSVKDIAPGFKVTALSKDGVVEAIEKVGTDKVWGVQFHPEGFVSAGDTKFLGIFKYLVEKAKENKK